MAKRNKQVTVPLPPAVEEFVDRVAEKEHRTRAGAIRHILAEAAAREADCASAAA
jgi:predicted transcriptional regulator